MSTSTMRVPASFRLKEALLQELKESAKAANRSLNNYVENMIFMMTPLMCLYWR